MAVTTSVYFIPTDGGYISSSHATDYPTAASDVGGTLARLGSSAVWGTIIGQDWDTFQYWVYEFEFAFNTNAVIPAANVISDVRLLMFGAVLFGTANFTLELRRFDYAGGGTTIPVTSDWQGKDALATRTLCGTYNSANYVPDGVTNTSDLVFAPTVDFKNNINRTGYTRLLMNSSRHRSVSTPTGQEYMGFVAAQFGAKLNITHAPVAPPFANPARY